MQSTYTTHSTEETQSLGRRLAQEIIPHTIVCLHGDLGAGKTTFTQGLLEGLGALHPYTSPTFVIMKQYDLPAPVRGIARIYHADAYRVGEQDMASLGFAEWCADMNGIVILEWPERVKNLIPQNVLHITLTSNSETNRTITIL